MQSLMVPEWHETKKGPPGEYLVCGLSGLEYLTWRGMVKSETGEDPTARLEAGHDVELSLEGRSFLYVVECGVSDWRNLDARAMKGGAPATFDKSRLKDLCLDHLDDLVSEILGRSVMTPDVEKNLSSRSKRPSTAKSSTAAHANGGDTAAA